MVNHNKNGKARSAAKKLMLTQKKNHGVKPKASTGPLPDDRPCQLKYKRLPPQERKRMERLSASNAAVKSGSKKAQFAKIEGTRIKEKKGGTPVRVIIADGREFDPKKVNAVVNYLKKLRRRSQQAKQTESELEKVHRRAEALARGEDPDAIDKAEKELEAEEVLDGIGKPKVKLAKDEAPVAPAGNRKKRKQEERREKMRKEHEEKMAREGRYLFKDIGRCIGVVEKRGKGYVWIKPAASVIFSLPPDVIQGIRDQACARRTQALAGGFVDVGPDGDVLQLVYADVAEQGLDLQPGVGILFQFFKSGRGVIGACDAVKATQSELSAAGASEKATPPAKRGRKGKRAKDASKALESAQNKLEIAAKPDDAARTAEVPDAEMKDASAKAPVVVAGKADTPIVEPTEAATTAKPDDAVVNAVDAPTAESAESAVVAKTDDDATAKAANVPDTEMKDASATAPATVAGKADTPIVEPAEAATTAKPDDAVVNEVVAPPAESAEAAVVAKTDDTTAKAADVPDTEMKDAPKSVAAMESQVEKPSTEHAEAAATNPDAAVTDVTIAATKEQATRAALEPTA